jgi:hypothetical protein
MVVSTFYLGSGERRKTFRVRSLISAPKGCTPAIAFSFSSNKPGWIMNFKKKSVIYKILIDCRILDGSGTE